MALRYIAEGRSRTSWPAGRPRGCNWSNCPSLRPGSQPRRGGMEAPQVRGVEEPLLPEPLRVEGRITQGQGALETQKRCHPRLHKAARIRSLGVCAEISKRAFGGTVGLRCGPLRPFSDSLSTRLGE